MAVFPEYTSGFLSRWRNLLLDWLKSEMIVDSADIRAVRTGFGIVLQLKKLAPVIADDHECVVSVGAGDLFSITDGQLVIGQRRFDISGLTVDGSTVGGVAPSVGQYTWAYIEIDMVSSVPSIALTLDGNKAADSFNSTEQLYRVNLSKWIYTASGWQFVVKALPDLHQHGILNG